MSSDKKEEQARAVLVQKHQLDAANRQLGDISSEIDSLIADLKSRDQILDEMCLELEAHVGESQIIWVDDEEDLELINEEYFEITHDEIPAHKKLDLLDVFDPESVRPDDYAQKVKEYAQANNLDLSDPFRDLLTVSQRIEFEKLIKDEFTLKTAKCDKYDYMIAGTCGLIGGLIDVFLVGAPGGGFLTSFTDDIADKATQKFAKLSGWEGAGPDKDPTASAIGYLERTFKVNYDQATSYGRNGTDGTVKNMSMSNHHIKSLGHSPDIVGLFFSILDQLKSTSHFVSEGKLVVIETETFELKGSTLPAKIFSGFCNWLGHVFSDMTGSSGTRGKDSGGRGAGVPIPFYSLLQFFDVGEFGQHRQSFATIAVKVFEEGYDLRHGMAMAIPVAISELLTRLMWTVKQRFYHCKAWKDCVPSAKEPELRRMLLVAHGSLCLIDVADATIRSGGNIVLFMLRSNMIAWVRFGTVALKELEVWYRSGGLDVDAVDAYLDEECERLIAR